MENELYKGIAIGEYFSKNNRLGEIAYANNGLLMEIINYNNASDIKVQFENNIVVNTTYARFQRGQVSCPGYNPHSKKYLGQKKYSTKYIT